MIRSSGWGGVSVLTALALTSSSVQGQQSDFSGYYLNVGTVVGESFGAPSGAADFQRFRLMWTTGSGPASLDVAYEQSLTLSETGVPSALLFTGGGVGGGGDWADLGGEIESGERWSWRHRVDRLSLQLDLGESADLVVGRQPISWATTLVMTPADPFSPFDPSDPFREYRVGVDAARLRYYRGAFTQVEAVVRPAKFGSRETLTALARVSTNKSGWDVGAWAGSLHDAFAAGVSASGGVGLWALRFEGMVRDRDDGAVLRSSVGIDRNAALWGKDLYVVLEYQRDGLGASDPDGFLRLLFSDELQQGEVQTLGRHTAAGQLSYQIHPLMSVDLLTLVSLGDGSVLVGPGLAYSVTHSAAVRLGAYASIGDDASMGPGGFPVIRSAYGATPEILFASLNLFF